VTLGDDRIERAFGALADWLELVRSHELRRRELEALARRARREQATRLLAAALAAVTVLAFALLVRSRG
jgi:hypothetical protein